MVFNSCVWLKSEACWRHQLKKHISISSANTKTEKWREIEGEQCTAARHRRNLPWLCRAGGPWRYRWCWRCWRWRLGRRRNDMSFRRPSSSRRPSAWLGRGRFQARCRVCWLAVRRPFVVGELSRQPAPWSVAAKLSGRSLSDCLMILSFASF